MNISYRHSALAHISQYSFVSMTEEIVILGIDI